MFRFKWRLIILVLLLLNLSFVELGWKKWLAMVPRPLPNHSLVGYREDARFSQGNYYEIAIPLEASTDDKLLGRYRLWIPDRVKSLQGLIVKQHGCGEAATATGLNHANDLQWQAMASKHEFALLGSQLPFPYPMCTDEAGIDGVTERSFLKALTALGEKSHHPELDKVPWALWGHSGGADWSMQMLHRYPERVIAVASIRCGGILFSSGKSEILDLDPKAIPTMLNVPVLWASGENDPNVEQCITLTKKIFSKFRNAGANWAIAVETNTAHETGETRFLAIPYLDASISKRLIDNSTELRPIEKDRGWLGNTTTYEIAPVDRYQGNSLEAAWLPNEETGRKWQQYNTMNSLNRLKSSLCRVGEKFFIFKAMQYPATNCYPSKILPTRQIAAPTNVRVTRLNNAEVLLTWNFSPDLENGLPLFRIYRDNAPIATFQGQKHNFGDAPENPYVTLSFRDKNAKNVPVYAVSAFNALGESISQPTRLTGNK